MKNSYKQYQHILEMLENDILDTHPNLMIHVDQWFAAVKKIETDFQDGITHNNTRYELPYA